MCSALSIPLYPSQGLALWLLSLCFELLKKSRYLTFSLLYARLLLLPCVMCALWSLRTHATVKSCINRICIPSVLYFYEVSCPTDPTLSYVSRADGGEEAAGLAVLTHRLLFCPQVCTAEFFLITPFPFALVAFIHAFCFGSSPKCVCVLDCSPLM